jgi:hypothetical protein
VHSTVHSILTHPKIKLKNDAKHQHVELQPPALGCSVMDTIRVYPPVGEYRDTKTGKAKTLFFVMNTTKDLLKQVLVNGISTVTRAVIYKEEVKGNPAYHLMVEGTDLRSVMSTPGVSGLKTKSNHVLEALQVRPSPSSSSSFYFSSSSSSFPCLFFSLLVLLSLLRLLRPFPSLLCWSPVSAANVSQSKVLMISSMHYT